MFFTIIIPTLNSGKKIYAAVQSVLSQKFIDFELLILDAHSSDDTLYLVNSFNDSRIKVIQENDFGIYDAMNKGISRSSGDWIYFLGSDDALFDNSVLDRAFEVGYKSKSKLIYGNVYVNGAAGWANDGQLYDGEFSLQKMLHRNICQQAIFYHRTLFDNYGYFNDQYVICADWDFLLRIAGSETIEYFPVTIAVFNGGGSSKKIRDKKFENDFLGNLYKYFKEKIIGEEFSQHHKNIKKLSLVFFRKGKILESIYLYYLTKKIGT